MSEERLSTELDIHPGKASAERDARASTPSTSALQAFTSVT